MIYELITETAQTVKELITNKISRNFYGKLKELNIPILCNNEVVKGYYVLNVGDKITFDYNHKDESLNILSNKPIDIIFEDDNYLVINKPHHINSIPTKKEPNDSVYNRVLYYFKDTFYTVHLMNRLDKETSGLILIAKNKIACARLKKFDKVYYAKTKTILEPTKGRIDLPILKEDKGIKRKIDDNGKRAITNYELIDSKDGIYIYRIILETGRTHQIRVHFSYLGAPLIGDKLYGNDEESSLALSCREIKFLNPFNNLTIIIKI